MRFNNKMKIHLYNIPSVDLYVNQLIASYLTIQSDFNQGDILMADRINRLQQKSLAIMRNIDDFMNKNALDPRVSYLYAARNKLFKFLLKIKENKLVKEVNQMKQNDSVYGLQSKKEQSIINHQDSLFKQQERDVVTFDDKISYNSPAVSRPSLTYNQQAKVYNQPTKKTPTKVNSTRHMRTPSTKLKYAPQNEKLLYPYEQNYIREKSRTPVKTSRKTEAIITPRNNLNSARNNVNNMSDGKQQTQTREGQYERKMPTYPQQQRSANSKSIITPRNKPTQSTSSKTPQKVSSNMKKSSNQLSVNAQQSGQRRQQYIEQNISTPGRNTLTPRQNTVNDRQQPSSAMKSLANLIFTIKMTKQEYNEFKKIKQQHEGKAAYMQ